MREVSDDSSRVPQGILQKNRGIASSSDLSEHLDDMLDKRIRSRYFHCLGLDQDLIRHDFPKSTSHSSYCKWSGRRRNGADSAALLKRDSGLLDESLTEPSLLLVVRPTRERVKRAMLAQPSNSNHKIESEKDVSSPCVQAKVSFFPTVQIHEIPSKSMYSDLVRRTMWVAPREAAQQALRRSIIEFTSEGYEVGGVFDESDLWNGTVN